MSPKKKRSKKADRSEPKKTPDAPFFRPFAGLSEQVKRDDKQPEPKKPAPAATPKRRPEPRPQAEDPDEMLTFERLMSGVTPLDSDGARRVPKSETEVESDLAKYARSHGAKQQEAAEQEALARLHALVEEGSRFEVQDDGRRIEGRRRGVDGGLVRRMRHGELPVDATIDLHGMRVEKAKEAVGAFVRDRRAKGDRVVVIVHGRGRNSPGQHPVLRGEVAAWLSDGPAAKHVSAFLTAPDEHGGEGAMSVLLAHPTENHRGMR